MRFHSTPESAENLEITVLAIIETVLSIAIYVCLGLYLGTFKYLALAAACFHGQKRQYLRLVNQGWF